MHLTSAGWRASGLARMSKAVRARPNNVDPPSSLARSAACEACRTRRLRVGCLADAIHSGSMQQPSARERSRKMSHLRGGGAERRGCPSHPPPSPCSVPPLSLLSRVDAVHMCSRGSAASSSLQQLGLCALLDDRRPAREERGGDEERGAEREAAEGGDADRL